MKMTGGQHECPLKPGKINIAPQVKLIGKEQQIFQEQDRTLITTRESRRIKRR